MLHAQVGATTPVAACQAAHQRGAVLLVVLLRLAALREALPSQGRCRHCHCCHLLRPRHRLPLAPLAAGSDMAQLHR